MKVKANTVVTVSYNLSSTTGETLDEGKEPMVYLHGGYGGTLEKIEEALEGHEKGYSTTIQVEPDDAFGDYEEDLVKIEPVEDLPSPLEVGMQLHGEPADGDEDDGMIFTVTDVADGKAVLDGNHPLAGIALRFQLTIDDVREATAEELSHGHVHGAHGVEHDEDEFDGQAEDGDQFRSMRLQ